MEGGRDVNSTGTKKIYKKLVNGNLIGVKISVYTVYTHTYIHVQLIQIRLLDFTRFLEVTSNFVKETLGTAMCLPKFETS